MTSGADEIAPPDPDKGIYIFCSGKKGSGKSVVCRTWWDAYPYDRVLIDPTHDVRADLAADGVDFDELKPGIELPARLPQRNPAKPRSWVFCPDMGADTAFDDMDRVVGLALGRGPTLLWCDEFGTMTTGNKSGPNMRRVLHHGRHDDLTLLLACPRPVDVNPLGINQADLVYMFATSNPDDRVRIAKNIGMDPGELDEINAELKRRGEFWHMLYDDRSDETWIMPPLPRRRGRPRVAGEPAAAAAPDLE
jgi:hypothetical protein